MCLGGIAWGGNKGKTPTVGEGSHTAEPVPERILLCFFIFKELRKYGDWHRKC